MLPDALHEIEVLPPEAHLFALQPGTKIPYGGSRGHHDALPRDAFIRSYLGGNYGIALDGQYLLVDIDAQTPESEALQERLPETWTQRTRRGKHYLYAVDERLDRERKNTRLPQIGDCKVRGYLVGPGSIVDGHVYLPMLPEQRPIVAAPSWLIDMLARVGDAEASLAEGAGRERIIIGERDNELTSIAGFLRHKGFGESAIGAMLAGVVTSGVVEQPEGDAISPRDVARIARSVARYEGGALGLGPLAAATWVSGADVNLVTNDVEWWIHGFVPHAELVTLYGRGGVGKSSFGSWLAAEVTKQGGAFLFIGVEEPFVRFLARAVLSGADRSKIFGVPQASQLMLPRDVQRLQEESVLGGIGVVYFDSVYSHFATQPGLNTAERARQCLGPLAEMAQLANATVIGVFHENKAGDYLGSVEMVNVARYVLKVEREKGDERMLVAVDKTNIWDPEVALTFTAPVVDFADPQTGRVQHEIVDGERRPMKIRVLVKGESTPWPAVEVEKVMPTKEEQIERMIEEAEAAEPGEVCAEG